MQSRRTDMPEGEEITLADQPPASVGYQQREPDAATFLIVGLWDPEVVPDEGEPFRLNPSAGDRYAVIDEIIEDTARLAVAPWPEVDVGGRLRFPVGIESRDYAYPLAGLQPVIERHRKRVGNLARPLRVGDVFFIRNFHPRALDVWQVVDITKLGREAAKQAALRAVAQVPSPERAKARRDLSWRQPPKEPKEPPAPPPPPSSTVNPAV